MVAKNCNKSTAYPSTQWNNETLQQQLFPWKDSAWHSAPLDPSNESRKHQLQLALHDFLSAPPDSVCWIYINAGVEINLKLQNDLFLQSGNKHWGVVESIHSSHSIDSFEMAFVLSWLLLLVWPTASSHSPGEAPSKADCWWKKSCTTWDVQNLVNFGIFTWCRISSIKSRIHSVPLEKYQWTVLDPFVETCTLIAEALNWTSASTSTPVKHTRFPRQWSVSKPWGETLWRAPAKWWETMDNCK